MNIPKISKRLEAAASFGRAGARIADVGTDHALLPIYLYTSGLATGGVVSDINQGPIERAAANLYAWGAEGAFECVRTDGLSGIDTYSPEDIYILGMGGELIARIIDDAKWLKGEGTRLILQPMTHAEAVRGYLFENGFSVIDECIVEDDKIYQIICAEYSGANTPAEELELLVGKINIGKGGELLCRLLDRLKNIYRERMKGKAIAGADDSYERELIKKIDDILNKEVLR